MGNRISLSNFNWPVGLFIIGYHVGLLIGLPLYFYYAVPRLSVIVAAVVPAGGWMIPHLTVNRLVWGWINSFGRSAKRLPVGRDGAPIGREGDGFDIAETPPTAVEQASCRHLPDVDTLACARHHQLLAIPRERETPHKGTGVRLQLAQFSSCGDVP